MADTGLQATAALGGVTVDIGDNNVTERDGLTFLSLAVPLGQEDAFAKGLRNAAGVDRPEPGRATGGDGLRALWTAPDQVLLMLEDETAALREAVAALAYVTDISGGLAALEISGPNTPAALERLCPLDLDPTSFPEGAVARTVMEHLSVTILRLAGDRFLLLSPRSSAGSFLHAVETSYRNVVG